MEVNRLGLGVVALVPGGGPHGHLGAHVAAQSAAHDLGEDPVNQENDHGAAQDHPAQAQQDEGEHEERLVTVRGRVRFRELDLKLQNSEQMLLRNSYLKVCICQSYSINFHFKTCLLFEFAYLNLTVYKFVKR